MTDSMLSQVGDENSLDLRFGDPTFLQELWSSIMPPVLHGPESIMDPEAPANLQYQNYSSSKELQKEIKDLHLAVRNVSYDTVMNAHVVVGAGATQIIHAALYALSKDYGIGRVYAKPPYFPRFKQFSSMQGLSFSGVTETNTDSSIMGNSIRIVTSPNNPDGTIVSDISFAGALDIVDACYNWPSYTSLGTAQELSNDIIVFSLAKLSGHASSRIGWALVKDRDTAALMEEYIELSSSGVSIDAQAKAAEILWILRNNGELGFFEKAAKILKARHIRLIGAMANVGAIKISTNGMFLYGQVIDSNESEDLLSELNVLGVLGPAFGDDASYFRLNIGVNSATFDELIQRMMNYAHK